MRPKGVSTETTSWPGATAADSRYVCPSPTSTSKRCIFRYTARRCPWGPKRTLVLYSRPCAPPVSSTLPARRWMWRLSARAAKRPSVGPSNGFGRRGTLRLRPHPGDVFRKAHEVRAPRGRLADEALGGGEVARLVGAGGHLHGGNAGHGDGLFCEAARGWLAFPTPARAAANGGRQSQP